MRLSRPCYDKPHRCPGWAGGGWKSAKRDRCDGGYVDTRGREYEGVFGGTYVDKHPGSNKWRFGRCRGTNQKGTEGCGVVTIPWALRKLDPRWWMIYWYRLSNWLYFRRNR